MRGSFQTLFRTALVLLCLATAAHADELDTLLSHPPSASLTAEDAASRIELVRGYLPANPGRADEIEAYLIPFVRVTQPPLELPTPTPAPPPAKAKPLLLVRGPDGVTTLRATTRARQGNVVIATTERGSRAVLQASAMMGELQWFTEEELESGAVDLNGVAGSYEAFVKAMPALRAQLQTEADRLRAMAQAREREAAEKGAAIEARVAAVTSEVYDIEAGYTRPGLGRLLLDAEEVRNELPQFASRIDEWAEPFRGHFTKLLSGHTRVNGAWVSNEELERQAYEKRQGAFLSGLDYRIGSDAAPAGAVRGVVMPYAYKLGFAIAAGLCVLALGWRRFVFRLAGGVLVAIASLAAAVLFFLATRDPALTPDHVPVSGEREVVDLLSQAAGLARVSSAPQRVTDAELNGFLSRHVRIVGGAASDGAGRQAINVRFLPGGIAIFEMVRCMGLSWIVRLDLAFEQADGRPSLALRSAKLGALGCPKELATALWNNLEPQLADILSSSRVMDSFAVETPAQGSIGLRAKISGAAREE